jgi:hypothetical protein
VRTIVVAFAVLGCSGPPKQAAPIEPTERDPPVTLDAAVVVEAPVDAAPPPTATLEGVVVAGELDVAKVTELLTPLAPELATCLGSAGPTTTELSLTIVKTAIMIRNAWQNDAATVPGCLRAIFKDKEERAWNIGSTTVYVVVKATPPGGTAPDAPKLGERRAEFQRLFCDLEKLAGAEKLGVPEKQNVMISWARDHIKHPAPLQVTSDVTTWNPAERGHKLEKAIKAEGIKKCALQRW